MAQQAADLHTSTVDLDAHMAAVHIAYRERRDALHSARSRILSADCAGSPRAGGMFVWARLPAGPRRDGPAEDGLAHGVAFAPGAPFHTGTRAHGHTTAECGAAPRDVSAGARP
ncbi:hypothetical protein B1K54_15840 [Streptomyces sp. fd1-xmd]|nr:hypothetical protein B1K54_15840 [Streptomyces sp. fd1-xmd]